MKKHRIKSLFNKYNNKPKFRKALKWLVISLCIICAIWQGLIFIQKIGLWPNVAETKLKKFNESIVDSGGMIICKDGDNGYGLGNTTPWARAYYYMPDTPNLLSDVKNIAYSQGFSLENYTEYINMLKGSTDAEGNVTTNYGGEEFNENADYLIANSEGNSLTVYINRKSFVAIKCESKKGDIFGDLEASSGNAIVEFSISLPDNASQ